MMLKILVVMAFSVILISCGKSDDSTAGTAVTSDANDSQVSVVSEKPAMVETANVQEQAVVAAKSIESAPEQAVSTADGESVYKKACISCHLTGAAGSPKLGDASAWEPRIAKGSAALVQSAIAGVPGTAMVARGACGTCSDDEIMAAVEYMITQSR